MKRNKKDKVGLFPTILIVIILVLVSGFRYNTGTDFSRYSDYFLTMKYDHSFFTSSTGDFGLKLFVFCLTYLTSNAQNFFLLAAIITNMMIIFTIRDIFSNCFHWGVSIYISMMYLSSFNIVAQCLATAFVVYAIKLFLKNDHFKGTLCVACAILIHSMALVYIPLFALASNVKTKWRILIVIGFSFSIFSRRNVLYDTYGDLINKGNSLNFTLILIPLIFLVILLSNIQKLGNNDRDCVLIQYSIYGLFFIVIFRGLAVVSNYFARFAEFFQIAYVSATYIIMKQAKYKPILKLIFSAILVFTICFYYYIQLKNNINGIFPYENSLLHLRINE